MKNINRYKAILIAIILYLLLFQIFAPHETNCLIKRTVGFPCPGCGMSRASYYLITLQFGKAFFYHPLVFIMPFIISVLLFNGYGVFHKLFTSKLFWGIIIGLFVVVYGIRMYLYFPHTEPMEYHIITNIGRNFL